MFGDVTILVLILPSDLLPARSFWHISMRCIPSWPARTTHLRWSAELLKSTTWRISAIRNSASARHSNVEKVQRTQTIYTQLLTWPTEKKNVFFKNLFPFIPVYFLSILLCSSELQIPDKANVFYAMCTSSNYDFVLRQRWRSHRRCFGSSSSPVDAAKTRFAKWKKKCLCTLNVRTAESSSSASAGQKAKWSSAAERGGRDSLSWKLTSPRGQWSRRDTEKSKLIKELWYLCRHVVLYFYKQEQDW